MYSDDAIIIPLSNTVIPLRWRWKVGATEGGDAAAPGVVKDISVVVRQCKSTGSEKGKFAGDEEIFSTGKMFNQNLGVKCS